MSSVTGQRTRIAGGRRWRLFVGGPATLAFGAFLAWHLSSIAGASQGRSAWEQATLSVALDRGLSFGLSVVVVLLVAGQVAVRSWGRSGLRLWPFSGRTSSGQSPSGRSEVDSPRLRSRLLLQAGSGFALLGFVVYHCLYVGIWRPSPRQVDFDALCAEFSSTHIGVPLVALAHLIGLGLALVFFASNLLSSLSDGAWPRTARGRTMAQWSIAAFTVLLGAWGVSAVLRFATGSAVPFVF